MKKGQTKNKFEPNGKEYVLVSYSSESKADSLREQGTKTVIKRRDVRFFEERSTSLCESKLQILEVPMEPEGSTHIEETISARSE